MGLGKGQGGKGWLDSTTRLGSRILQGLSPPAAPLPSPPSPCQVPMDFPAVARSRWTLWIHSENQSPIIIGPFPNPPRPPTLTSCHCCQVFMYPLQPRISLTYRVHFQNL